MNGTNATGAVARFDKAGQPLHGVASGRDDTEENQDWHRFSEDMMAQAAALGRFARRRARGHDDLADDLVQETLLRAWANRDRFTPGTNLTAWLFTILRNAHISHIRKTRREQVGLDEGWKDNVPVAANQEDHVALAEVLTAMDRLPSTDSAIFTSILVHGSSHLEIAAQSGCALGTVRSRLFRARQHLTRGAALRVTQGARPPLASFGCHGLAIAKQIEPPSRSGLELECRRQHRVPTAESLSGRHVLASIASRQPRVAADGAAASAPLYAGPVMTGHHFPDYSFGERRCDGVVHVVGVVASLVAAPGLLVAVASSGGLRTALVATVYGATLVAALGASAAYHLARQPERKEHLRKLDHASIFLLIAGTYTPFAAVGLGGSLGEQLMAGVWLVAMLGVVLKIAWPRRFDGASVLLYLGLGWAGVAAARSLVATLPATALVLLAAGGVLYTAGVAFHLWRRLPYHNAIWHALVLCAAACHYIAVFRVLTGARA